MNKERLQLTVATLEYTKKNKAKIKIGPKTHRAHGKNMFSIQRENVTKAIFYKILIENFIKVESIHKLRTKKIFYVCTHIHTRKAKAYCIKLLKNKGSQKI